MMKGIFRYILALTVPLFMASCGEKPEMGKEAFLVIKDAPEIASFNLGETKSFTIEQTDVETLSIDSPAGWRGFVNNDKLVVAAPAEGEQNYDKSGLVTITFAGTDKVEKRASLNVAVVVPEPEPPVEDEEVTFQLILSDVTATSAHLEVIPSDNNVRYYYDVCTAEDYESVGGDVGVIIGQYIDYLLAYNPSLTMEQMLDIMLSQGPDSDTVTGLPKGTEMCFYAIAVDDEGKPYSEPAVEWFTTEEGGDPSECTFEMSVSEIKGTTIFIEITPSDPSVRYWYAVTPRDGYPGDIPMMVEVKNEAQSYADEIGMTLEEVIEGVTVAGPVAENWYDLNVNTGYYLYAFAMDEQGNAVGPMFKEGFTTAESDISDADITLSYKYFDGDELYDSYPEIFPNAAGRVIVQVQAEPNFYASDWAVALGAGDMTDSYTYPDDATINAILASGAAQYNKTISTFYANWSDCTIFGFAADYNGFNGVLHRILVQPVKEEASPVSDFVVSSNVASAAAALSIDAPSDQQPLSMRKFMNSRETLHRPGFKNIELR